MRNIMRSRVVQSRLVRFVGIAAVGLMLLAGVVAASARWGDDEQLDVTNLPGWDAPELIPSTRPFPLAGGASVPFVSQEQLPAVSDAAVVATVEAIHKPVANTTTGELPIIRGDLGPDQLSSIVPITLVDIRIHEILGQRPGSEHIGAPGELVTITVPGGWLDFVLDEEGIRALQILEIAPGYEEGPGTVAPEVPPQAPYPWRMTLNTTVYLETGETVVLFLSKDSVPRFDPADVRRPPELQPMTWISYGEAGVVRVSDVNSVPQQIRDVAGELNSQVGPRREVWQLAP